MQKYGSASQEKKQTKWDTFICLRQLNTNAVQSTKITNGKTFFIKLVQYVLIRSNG